MKKINEPTVIKDNYKEKFRQWFVWQIKIDGHKLIFPTPEAIFEWFENNVINPK